MSNTSLLAQKLPESLDDTIVRLGVFLWDSVVYIRAVVHECSVCDEGHSDSSQFLTRHLKMSLVALLYYE